ncbi:MAG: hypothetical protein ACREOI_34020, partial [bacterium]
DINSYFLEGGLRVLTTTKSIPPSLHIPIIDREVFILLEINRTSYEFHKTKANEKRWVSVGGPNFYLWGSPLENLRSEKDTTKAISGNAFIGFQLGVEWEKSDTVAYRDKEILIYNLGITVKYSHFATISLYAEYGLIDLESFIVSETQDYRTKVSLKLDASIGPVIFAPMFTYERDTRPPLNAPSKKDYKLNMFLQINTTFF